VVRGAASVHARVGERTVKRARIVGTDPSTVTVQLGKRAGTVALSG
jgi:hypothetical protein